MRTCKSAPLVECAVVDVHMPVHCLHVCPQSAAAVTNPSCPSRCAVEDVFNDGFWEGLDVVVNALDNVNARSAPLPRQQLVAAAQHQQQGLLGLCGR